MPRDFGGGITLPQGGLQNGGGLLHGNDPNEFFQRHRIQIPGVPINTGSMRKLPSKAGGCVNCQPVPPENVIGYISTPYDPSSGIGYADRDHPVPNFLTNRSDVERKRNQECSSAVISLRTPNSDGVNLIDQFDQRCLLSDSEDFPFLPRIPIVETCQQEYATFASSCVSPALRVNKALLGRIGILISTISGQDPKILCTATLLDGRTVITARHCLERVNFPAGSDDNIPIAFLPNPTLDPHSGRPPPPVGIEGEVDSRKNVHRLKLIDSMPALADDILVLRLSREIGLENPGIAIVAATAPTGEKLSLIGYHDFLTRKHILNSRIEGKTLAEADAVISDGSWAGFMMVDDSSTCFSVSADNTEIDHFCQSFGGTSGAPLFTKSVEDDNRTVFYLAGVQSRGSLAEDESTGQTNQAAAVATILSQLGYQEH